MHSLAMASLRAALPAGSTPARSLRSPSRPPPPASHGLWLALAAAVALHAVLLPQLTADRAGTGAGGAGVAAARVVAAGLDVRLAPATWQQQAPATTRERDGAGSDALARTSAEASAQTDGHPQAQAPLVASPTADRPAFQVEPDAGTLPAEGGAVEPGRAAPVAPSVEIVEGESADAPSGLGVVSVAEAARQAEAAAAQRAVREARRLGPRLAAGQSAWRVMPDAWARSPAGGGPPSLGPDPYLPRSMLTRAPVPASPVSLLFPPEFEEDGLHVAVLSVFIDEQGQVRRLRVDSGHLPAALEAAARRAFENLVFRPGELQGRAVKSLMRIEVRFESRPADGGTAKSLLAS